MASLVNPARSRRVKPGFRQRCLWMKPFLFNLDLPGRLFKDRIGQGFEDNAVNGKKQEHADDELERIIDSSDFLPVGGHERIRAGPEGNGIEDDRVEKITENRRCARRQPPSWIFPELRENLDIGELPQHIRGKAGKGDPEHEGVECCQNRDPLKYPLGEYHGNNIGKDQRRQHGLENNAPRLGIAEYPHGKIGGQVDKGETEGSPGRVQAKDLHGNLDQIITGGNDGNMKQ